MKSEEQILNLRFYKGEDKCNGAEIEEELLEVVKNYDDYEEYLKKDNRWPFLYHLSPIRENLLEWYNFNPEGSLLEIGAECGALTGMFCSKLSKVVAIEESKKCSLINANRNIFRDNLEIIVGHLKDIILDEKFDYVTLIGNLSLAGRNFESEDAVVKMIDKAKSFLKPGGVLIIALANKYGLKYWAGASEDYTGNMYDSLTGYKNIEGIKTYSRMNLEKLLVKSGFSHNDFYYPLPDYKLPNEVYSSKRLPKRGAIQNVSVAYDRDRISSFDEVAVYDELCDEGMFEFFANSFLVFSIE